MLQISFLIWNIKGVPLILYRNTKGGGGGENVAILTQNALVLEKLDDSL